MSATPAGDQSSWSTECFDVSIRDNVAHLALNRPSAFNTMTPAFWRELPQIVRDIDDNARARCIVISSSGKHFCAGMDLAVFGGGQTPGGGAGERGRTAANLRRVVRDMQATFDCLDEARMPVIAAIQGGCIGGAIDMTSACDIRYCTADAFFVIQEINIGMTADVGTFPRLCHLIPQGWVREMAYTGRRVDARTALRIGLVNEVFEDHEAVVNHALLTAREIASKTPLSVHGSKVMINYARDHSLADGLDYIATWQAGMFNPETDMKEALTARLEKREPRFEDLLPVRKPLGG